MKKQELIKIFKVKAVCIPDHKVHIYFIDAESYLEWIQKGGVYEMKINENNGNTEYVYYSFDDICVGILKTNKQMMQVK